MIALLNQIPSEAQIQKQLRNLIFGSHLFCPRCHSRQVHRSEYRYRCRMCRKPFSLLSGTWLASMKLSLRTFWGLLWCWTQRIPILQTQKLCHVSEETARFWFRSFRLHLPDLEPILQGTIQMDEAYFKSLSLLMAKQTGTKHIAHQMIPKGSIDKTEATRFIFQSVGPNSNLLTDGSGIYKGIEQWWQVRHRIDIHRRFEFGLTSEIEGLFGNLRTFIRRMYHHVTPEYLPELVAEFSMRFSHPEYFLSPHDYLTKSLKPVPFD